jgi:hypothetical protein
VADTKYKIPAAESSTGSQELDGTLIEIDIFAIIVEDIINEIFIFEIKAE